MFSIGNDELDMSPELGKTILCPQCGKRHRIAYGEKVLRDGTKVPFKTLAFYKCKGKPYIAGINGRDITRRK